jgi:lantibiotic transport system permease protein
MMLNIGRAVYSETLKLKRTLALKMIFIAPVLVALLGLALQSAAVSRGRGNLSATHWESLTRNSLTVWAVFLMPFLITLETSLLCAFEHGEKQWKHLLALPLPRYAVYASKYVTAQALVFSSTVVLCVCLLVSGRVLMLWHPVLASAGPPPMWSIVSRSLQCWLAAGFICPPIFGLGCGGRVSRCRLVQGFRGHFSRSSRPLQMLQSTTRTFSR